MPPANIRDLLMARFGAPVSPRFQRELNTVQVASGVILRNDPSRIGFAIVNVGGSDVNLVPSGQPTPTRGFIAAANGGTVTAQWDEDGELVNREWTAFAVGAPSPVLVLEALIEKAPEKAAP